jgi:homoserine kinase type II
LIPSALNIDLARILEHYPAPYHADPAQTALPASGFSGALIWRIETPAGPRALRAVDVDAVDRDRLAGLHRLIGHVRTCGFLQVPAPIVTLDAATFLEYDGRVWQLEPWMPGSADFARRPTDERLREALTTLARWHLAASGFEPRGAESTWFYSAPFSPSPGLARRAREIARWNSPTCDRVRRCLNASSWTEFAVLGRQILDDFRRAAPGVVASLALQGGAPVPLQPCLRDVWHDHVLFTGDAVTGLIDPHSARTDSVATDLARLLGSLVGDDRRAWQTGLDAYQQVRPLSLAELALLELFDQTAVLLSGMTWLDWLCLEHRTFDNREKVLGRLQAIAARLKNLV